MNVPRRAELQDLLKQADGPCVSLFMPTYRTSGADRRQGPTQLENMLHRASGQLMERGLRRPAAEELLQSAHALTKDVPYWHNSLADGLAVFVSKHVFRQYKVPVALEERIFVDDQFHIAPLLPLYSGDTRFYILAISQNAVRLLEGNRYEVHELPAGGLPKNLMDALQKVADSEPRPGNLHEDRYDQLGHGTGLEHVNHRLERYFREIDTNLLPLLASEEAPLVLAGVERNVGLYRCVSAHRRIPERFIDGNPELMSAKQLHSAALEIVAPYVGQQEEQARQQIERLGGTERVATDPEQIIAAAQNGRIDTLFLRRGYELWGQFDSGRNATDLHERRQDGDRELVTVTAEKTFVNGGAVLFEDDSHTPRPVPMTALLRY
jgi:hypothetical protein